jgi:hypothetical protein
MILKSGWRAEGSSLRATQKSRRQVRMAFKLHWLITGDCAMTGNWGSELAASREVQVNSLYVFRSSSQWHRARDEATLLS